MDKICGLDKLGKHNTASELILQLRPSLGGLYTRSKQVELLDFRYLGSKREPEGKRTLRIAYGSTEIIDFHLEGL